MWKPGLFEFLFSFRKLERNGNSNREPQQYFHSITISCQLTLNKVLIKLTFSAETDCMVSGKEGSWCTCGDSGPRIASFKSSICSEQPGQPFLLDLLKNKKQEWPI